MHKIRLANGVELAVTMCLETQGILWIRFDTFEMTATQIVTLFDDESNTRVIEDITDSSTIKHTGFVSLIQYTRNDFGIMVGLKRE